MTKSWWTTVLLTCSIFAIVQSARVEGNWNPNDQRVLVVAKFGYQQIKPSNPKDTRGFLFGNIQPVDTYNYSNPVLLALVSQTNIGTFKSDSEYGLSCGSMLQNLTKEGFESRCFPNGTSDFFRWVPCRPGHLCKDEDNAANVISGHQMTMQVQEPYNPEYWYVVLLSCRLDESCQWTDANVDQTIHYDFWLTNGRPNTDQATFFTFNFSFDEQNTVQILSIIFVMYCFLAAVLSRAKFRSKHHILPRRTRALSWILTCKVIGYGLQTVNVVIYAYDGKGVFIARFIGEILRNASVQLLCLLLLLLARGWDITHTSHATSKPCIALWAVIASLDIIFFFCNFIFVYDTLHEVDVFSAWPGHGMIVNRIIYAMWFLKEIRQLIDREENEEKAVFLANFGAGFLVWFISLPMIGIVATFVSQLWRLNLILALTAFANYTALVCLVHQFWPTSSYRKFFSDYMNAHRRLGRSDSTEMSDYEQMFYDFSDSENDYPEQDASLHHQSI